MSYRIFEQMERYGHEQVIFNYDKTTGLKAIIAIHDSILGPALGGCRMYPYPSEDEALEDVLRLSKGMTYKCGISGVDFGGGKTVIIGDPEEKTEGTFRALGRFVEMLQGRYYTGVDVGTVPEDFVNANRESDFIIGLPEEFGGSGNPSVNTAYGTVMGLKACVEEKFRSSDLSGVKVAVQGLGKVGLFLVSHLIEHGALVTVTDISKDAIEKVQKEYPSVEVVDPDDIYEVDCDIFSPNALGGVINDFTVEKLNCKIVAGAANNQLYEEKHGQQLYDKGILYAPDYIVNAGGLIQASDEIGGHDKERVRSKTERIYEVLLQVFEISRREGVTPEVAAGKLVDQRIDMVRGLRSNYVG